MLNVSGNSELMSRTNFKVAKDIMTFPLTLGALVLLVLLVNILILNISSSERRNRIRLTKLLELSDTNNVCELLGDIWSDIHLTCENYDVVTSDGYTLRLKRLRGSRRSRKVVLLVPGLGDSASTFVLSGRNASLAGTLLDSGLELWLFDPRGRSPLTHLSYTSDDLQFWDFSLDEKVDIDIPLAIRTVLDVSGVTSLHGIIGHSQGALAILLHLAHRTMWHRPENETLIKQAFLLAPPISGWDPNYAMFSEGLIFPFLHRIIPGKNQARAMHQLREWLSRGCLAAPNLCLGVTCLLSGCGKQSRLDKTRLSTILTFYPSASSLKNIEQLLHCERKAGVVRNFLKDTCYILEDFSQIETPLHLYFGAKDRLVDKRRYHEGLRLFNRSTQTYVKSYRVYDYGHADFVWSENARELVYEHIAEVVVNA